MRLISPDILHFLHPIFSKHKKIFLFLAFDGVISGTLSILMPLLLKWETDQLVGQKTGDILGYHFSAF